MGSLPGGGGTAVAFTGDGAYGTFLLWHIMKWYYK